MSNTSCSDLLRYMLRHILFPVIRDFNVTSDDYVLDGLDSKMSDARRTALKTDSRATFNAWGKSASIIDYIYHSGFSECVEFETIVRQYKGVLYISDHYPIVARLMFP